MELRDGLVDLVRGHHFAAGRIHFQDDGFDPVILLRAVELRLDHVHHVVAGLVHRMVGDDAVHRDDGDFAARVVVFQQAFFEPRADFARNAGGEIAD